MKYMQWRQPLAWGPPGSTQVQRSGGYHHHTLTSAHGEGSPFGRGSFCPSPPGSGINIPVYIYIYIHIFIMRYSNSSTLAMKKYHYRVKDFDSSSKWTS
jgi:hypothetical protein